MRVDDENKVIYVPDNMSLDELARFLTVYPFGEYEILIHEFDENADTEWELSVSQ